MLEEKGILRSHQVVVTEFGNGEITSGTFSPTLGHSVALARVPRSVKVGDIVQVEMRKKNVNVTVTKPNFVRNGKKVF